jgi:hypothetical protein
VELVAGAGETPRTHALEATVDLEVREAHLHFLALIPRLFKFRGCPLESAHDRACRVADAEQAFRTTLIWLSKLDCAASSRPHPP